MSIKAVFSNQYVVCLMLVSSLVVSVGSQASPFQSVSGQVVTIDHSKSSVFAGLAASHTLPSVVVSDGYDAQITSPNQLSSNLNLSDASHSMQPQIVYPKFNQGMMAHVDDNGQHTASCNH